MKQYKVRLTTQASGHILDYAEYIQNELFNPQAARRFVKDIRAEVNSLSQMPQRNPLVEEEPWHSMGIYKLMVRGYLVYYWIDDETEVVHITGVVYGKRNQINQLADMDFEP